MTKRAGITAVMLTAAMLLLIVNISKAESGWELKITAGAGNAENKLMIGQRSDAGDGVDDRYDVPALITGDIEAYIQLEGGKYWRDIKQTCSNPKASCIKTWNIIIKAKDEGNTVKLTWKSSSVPQDISLTLTDMTTGGMLDMKAYNEYKYKNTGERSFRIETYQ